MLLQSLDVTRCRVTATAQAGGTEAVWDLFLAEEVPYKVFGPSALHEGGTKEKDEQTMRKLNENIKPCVLVQVLSKMSLKTIFNVVF